MFNLVYVDPGKDHWKEDHTWACRTPEEALGLTKWLIELGLNAQRIDQEVFDAMPLKIERE